MTAVLEIRKLQKSFGALHIARDIEFDLAPGARHALIGPNGAGKTTFVNLVTGVLAPSGGTIHLNGHDVTTASPERRVAMGLARTFQINSLFLTLTVAENVALAVAAKMGIDWRPWTILSRNARVLEDVHGLLQLFDLVHLAEQPLSSVAYGQRRLVELALALALKPKVLLLDEPAAGLPKRDSAKLLQLLLQLPKDIAVLVVEHDMELVFGFAQRMTVMFEGRILAEGSPEEIRKDTRVRDVYLGHRRHV